MAALATDSFNRANANPIGANWTTVTSQGAFQIVSNAATVASLAADSASLHSGISWTGVNDQYAQANITQVGGGGGLGTGFGLVVRGDAATATMYRLVVGTGSNNIELAKLITGAYTLIWDRTATFNSGDLIRLEAQGTTLRVFINGVQVGANTTDSSIASGSPGMGYSASATSGSMDNWEAGDFTSASPGFPPNLEQRRRLLVAPRLVRGGGRISTPVRAQVNPPFPFAGIKQPRRLRGLGPRRGEAWAPVPPQVVAAAPTRAPLPVRARLKGLRLFRPEAFTPAASQVAPPQEPARFRFRGLRVRGRVAGPVPAQVTVTAQPYPPQNVRARLRGLRLFRGHVAGVVPPQIVVTPPAYVPASVRVRVRGLRLFRGRSAGVVPPQIVVQPPAYVPPGVRPLLKRLRLFRARTTTPSATQVAAPPAPHPRPRGMAPRRGHVAMPIPPQIAVTPPAYPPRPVRSRLKGLRLARGRTAAPVPAQVVIVPPKFPPLFARIKQHAARIFRGSARTPAPPVCDCHIARPDTGFTARPGSGFTARPGSGVTARPAMGMTARPDDGNTARPCTCGGG